MKNNKSIFFILTIFFITSGFIISSIEKPQFIESEKLELTIAKDSTLDIKASIFNNSANSVKIVLPGDGSMVGWRTPIVRWSVIKKGEKKEHPNELPKLVNKFERCGTVNALELEEIISISPKSQVELNGWIFYPELPEEIGEYSVKLYFLNDPNHKLVERIHRDPEIDKVIKDETKEFLLISNELIYEVVK